MLRRMVKRKEIKLHKIDTAADWFTLNSTPRKYASRYYHEVAAADLFVAFLPHFKSWTVEKKLKDDRIDRGVLINNSPVYFEVDMCTENISILYDKVENAISYSNETNERFHTVFVFCGNQEEVDKRGNKLIQYLRDKKRGDQFTITTHKALTEHPLGEVIYTPKGELKAINNLL